MMVRMVALATLLRNELNKRQQDYVKISIYFAALLLCTNILYFCLQIFYLLLQIFHLLSFSFDIQSFCNLY